MLKKWIAPALVLATVAAAPAWAIGPVDVGLGADYVTRYIWRGYDLVPDNNPAFQPSGSVGFSPMEGLDLSAAVWASYGLSDSSDKASRDKNEWDEIDYTVGLDYAITDTLSVSLGHIYYFFPQVSDSDLNDTKEVYVGVSMGLPYDLSTGLTVYYDYDNGKGIYANWTIDYSRSLSEAVAVAAGFNVGYVNYTEDAEDDGFYVDADGDALQTFSDATLSMGVDVDLGYGFALANYLYYTMPLGDLKDDVNDNNEAWGKVTLSYSF